MADVFYTQTFAETLRHAVSFLAEHIPIDEAIDKVLTVQDMFEERMVSQPLSCPECRELAGSGFPGLYEYHHHKFRIIYFLIESDSLVVAVSLTHQKQSLKKLAEEIFPESLEFK